MNTAKMLREHGLRVTPQRAAILEFVAVHPVHPTADAVFDAVIGQCPGVSRTTVYNTLHTLQQAGLIIRFDVDGETRFDGNTAPHGHFQCESCGRLFDYPLDAAALRAVSPAVNGAALRSLVFTGKCSQCSES